MEQPLTLAEAKEYLRVDLDDEDGYISILLLLAKELSTNYLRQELPAPAPLCIKQAMLLIVAHFFEHRDGAPVPAVVYRLLDAYRRGAF